MIDKEHFGRKIIEKQLPLFKSFIGPDLFVQKDPYLRVTRSEKPQDNIGCHRNTFYGGSPYELSILVPYMNINEFSALQVMTGSHTLPENHFPTKQIKNSDPAVQKGSAKHQLGFLYAPKVMDPLIASETIPIPLKLGQALAFSLSIVHGSVVNKGRITHWSSDIRVMNAFASVDLTARPNYYESLCSSEITLAEKKHFSASANEAKT